MKLKPSQPLLRFIRPLAKEAHRKGIKIYAVGGCVRDWILNVESKDLDLVLESDPTPLARYCVDQWGGRFESFGQFGTVRFLAAGKKKNLDGGFRIDFVRARAEAYSSPAALPQVRPGSLSDDLARRDFTVNAMATELMPEGTVEVIDLFGGLEDIRKRTIRVLHAQSFRDDPTRIFRAARYSCRYRMRLETGTEELIRKAVAVGYVKLLSRERLRNEFLRILAESDPGCSIKRIREWNILDQYHPKLTWPKRAAAGRTPFERLGIIALTMDQEAMKNRLSNRDGVELVRGLNLERNTSHSILEALDLVWRHISPRSELDPLSRSILELGCPRLSRAALEPLLVTGKDLQKIGLQTGPRFSEILEGAAEAQWAGEFSTRPEALRWLRASLSF